MHADKYHTKKGAINMQITISLDQGLNTPMHAGLSWRTGNIQGVELSTGRVTITGIFSCCSPLHDRTPSSLDKLGGSHHFHVAESW